MSRLKPVLKQAFSVAAFVMIAGGAARADDRGFLALFDGEPAQNAREMTAYYGDDQQQQQPAAA